MVLLGQFLNIKIKYDKLPGYYYDYKNKKNKILPLFPKPIQTLLINYWEKHGNNIRQYRNLDFIGIYRDNIKSNLNKIK